MPRSSNARAKKDTPEALAQMVWAAVAPMPQLAKEPAGPVYYTAQTYAAAHNMTRCTAQRRLDALAAGDKPVLRYKFYRVTGRRQPNKVYWPLGVAAPDEVEPS